MTQEGLLELHVYVKRTNSTGTYHVTISSAELLYHHVVVHDDRQQHVQQNDHNQDLPL